MKTNQLLTTITFLLGIIFLSSCASISGFQTARTVEKEGGEFSAAINLTSSPEFTDELSADDIQIIAFPNVELGGRYGVADKIDIGLRINTTLNFLIDGKFQVYGDQESKFAVALGAGIGGFAIAFDGALLNFQVPLYTSFHPNEKLHIYLSPRFIGQFGTSFDNVSGLLAYSGGNFGIMFGQKNRFGLDFGFYNLKPLEATESVSLINIGIGGAFAF